MLLYFDTSIFLRWFKEWDEEKYRDCTEGIAAIMEGFKSGKLQIVTSTATLAELMPENTGETVYKDIVAMLDFIEIRPLDIRVAVLAGHLRDVFYPPGSGRSDSKLKTLDAIHLSTAIYAQADYLCTTDEDFTKRDKKLIKKVAGREIEIVEPPILEIGKIKRLL